jgi:RNA polymerase sigma-70 factor, ECF subfamily
MRTPHESLGKTLDEDLLSAGAHGDRMALEELFTRYGESVTRLLSRLGGAAEMDLEDLLQTTFLEAQRSAKGFDGRSSVKTWILGIAINVWRHYVRGEVRRRAFIYASSPIAAADPGPKLPDDLFVEREAMARLRDGLESLPKALRMVFTLCEIEGLKGTESARILGVPEGTVWRRLHEARVWLRAAIDGRRDAP